MAKYCPQFSKLVRYKKSRNLVCPKDEILRKRSKREIELMPGNLRNVSFVMMAEEKEQVMVLLELQITVGLLINKPLFKSDNLFFNHLF
jgi:hypothetical protein